MSMDNTMCHSQDKELEFLRGLEAGRWRSGATRVQIMKALTNYINTVRLRKWDCKMDVDFVHSYAQGLLANLMEKA